MRLIGLGTLVPLEGCRPLVVVNWPHTIACVTTYNRFLHLIIGANDEARQGGARLREVLFSSMDSNSHLLLKRWVLSLP